VEQAILRELEAFILELGSDFAFVARQKRMTVDDEDYGPFQKNCNTNEDAQGQEKGSDPNGTAACEA
jgi:hypothetical protein